MLVTDSTAPKRSAFKATSPNTKPTAPAPAGVTMGRDSFLPSKPTTPQSGFFSRDVFLTSQSVASAIGSTIVRDLLDVNDSELLTEDLKTPYPEASARYMREMIKEAGFAGEDGRKKAQKYVDAQLTQYAVAVNKLLNNGQFDKVMEFTSFLIDDVHLPEQATLYKLLIQGRFAEVQRFGKAGKDLADADERKARQEKSAGAREQLKTSAPLETEALRGLGERQSQYQQLRARFADDAFSSVALQMMLLEGKFEDLKKTDHEDLLGALTYLQTAPLHAGIDRHTLLRDLIREVATPTAINQKSRGTCTVTAFQIFMAERHPGEYVRLVTGLAGPDGEVRTRSGSVVKRVPTTELTDGTNRTLSSRLWQPAMMDLGNGPDQTYSNDKDSSFDASGADQGAGLALHSLGLVVSGVMGKEATLVSEPAKVFGTIQEATTKGMSVLAALRWDSKPDAKDKNHEILVTKVSEDRVYFANPHGREESLPLSDFKARAYTALVPND